MNKKEICQCRHPKELKLFGFAAVITGLIFIGLLAGSFYRNEIIDVVKSEAVATYKVAHPTAQNLSDAEVVKKLPTDDKDMLELSA